MLEAVAYALKNNIDYGSEAFHGLEEQLTVVGDVSKSDLWLEIITNVTGRPVRVLPNSGKAAYGAAVLAAYGVGLIDRGQLVDWLGARQKATVLTPDPAVNAVYERCFANFKRLYDHMRSYFPTVTEG
jgi:xylulokinase